MDPPPLSVQTPRRVSKSHECHLIPHQPEEKVRLMCSYGGRIVPRPHDKSLCYVGGDTRIVVVDRHSSLRQLSLHLSRTLLHGRPFILKYLLPNEDLDNLISVTLDEDLQLMIQEYDRITAASSLKASRLRLFLFLCNPESATSMNDAKQETWFVDAINDSRILSRAVSGSAAVDCLVNPDAVPPSDSSNNLEALALIHDNKIKSRADLHSVPDSVVVDKTSPSRSPSSSPSMASLPPIGADSGSRLNQEHRPGTEELSAQLNFATTEMMKQDDGCAISSAPRSPPVRVADHNMNGVASDVQASEITHSPSQLVHPRTSDALSLLFPDSVASKSKIALTDDLSKPVEFQDQMQTDLAKMRSEVPDPSPAIQRDQALECGYRLATQLDQKHQLEQFVHYVQLPASTGQVAMPSYYPAYAPPSHHPTGQHYPVYVIPVGPTQPIGVPSGRPLIPQNGAASTAYNNATPSVNRVPNPAFLQPTQFQQHHVGFPQLHWPPYSNIAFAPPPIASTSHGFQYGSIGTFLEQTTTPLPPHHPSMIPPISSGASKDNIQ